MQFKHPEILYALLLLIIPIIVHLFHLQRFVKVPFTNVKFLKKIDLQTRKSSRLKKWLILATRLLAFTSIILAFSQPYFSNIQKNTNTHTIIYLDNSMSMGIKVGQQEILKKTVQEIIENLETDSKITLLTNDGIQKNIDQKELKNELLNLKYSSIFQNFETILMKIKQQILKGTNTSYNIILISDFQSNKKINKPIVTNVNTRISLINVAPKQFQNSILDSVYLSNKNNQEITLNVVLKNINTTNENVSISLFNNTNLIGKTTTPFEENTTTKVEFKILFQKNFLGRVVIDDENLMFDNTLFFSISKPEKIKIISIGKKSAFIQKIYTSNEFDFQYKTITKIDYNQIENQHLIILNEIKNIHSALLSTLKLFVENGGSLIIIPPNDLDFISYNSFFSSLNIGTITEARNEKLDITSISYDHPLLKNVFENKVSNFQYPSIKMYFTSKFRNISPIISLENQQAFISQINSENSAGNIYWFNSPLNIENSNFQNSPVIVPIFYNMGIYSYQFSELYYTIGNENTIEISAKLKKDNILKLKNGANEFIPLQQIFYNKVKLKIADQPNQSGFYTITNNNDTLKTIAFNYNRQESELNYTNINKLFKDVNNIDIYNSVEDTFNELNEQQQIKSLFKWFLGLTVLFLLLEMCILKFFNV